MQPLHNVGLLRQITAVQLTDKPGETQDAMALAAAAVMKGLNAIDHIVAEFAHLGKFAVGTEQPSVADVFLVPQLYAAKTRFNVDLESFPNLNRIYCLCESVHVFKVSDPYNQPDAPPLTIHRKI